VSQSSFIESTLRNFARAFSRALVSEQAAKQPGLIQTLDPRVRVLGLLALVVSVVLCRRLGVVAAIWLLAVVIALASRVSFVTLATRVWLVVLLFTGIIAVPAIFLTPGTTIFSSPAWHLVVSLQGLRSAAMLVLRVEAAATLTTILVLCTPWNQILKALRSLRLPVEVVAMLEMTHRYVFLLVETANQMFEARQSRTIGKLSGQEQRKITARTAGVLLGKSMELSHEVYLAMLSRGFNGEVHLMTNFRMKLRDYGALAAFLSAGAIAVWAGR